MQLVQWIDLLRPHGALHRHRDLPPPVPISPFVQLYRWVTDQATFLEDARRLVGPSFTVDLPGYGPVVAFTDEESVRRLATASPEDFGHSNDIAGFFVGPKSVLLLEGDEHAKARARTLSAFTGERMRGYGPTILDAARRFVDGLGPSQRFSAKEAGRTMALEVILRALFGLERGPEYDRTYDLVTRFMDGGHSPLATLMALYLPAETIRGIVSGRRDPTTMRLLDDQGPLGVAGKLRGIREGRELLDGLCDLIERRSARLDDVGTDALGFILRKAAESGQSYSLAEAVDETLTLLLAGHDTTAVTLSWALHRLGRAPAVVRKMRDELDAAYGDGPIDSRTIERLPYLAAVLDETFRLDGIGRGISRRPKRDMRFGSYDIPAGTIVLGYTYCRNRDPSFWDFPDDFVPDQFVGRRLRPHEFTPFGGGFRRCLGAAFAEYEIKILLAEIVRRVDFVSPADDEVKSGMLGPIIGPVGPVPIDVRAVRPSARADGGDRRAARVDVGDGDST